MSLAEARPDLSPTSLATHLNSTRTAVRMLTARVANDPDWHLKVRNAYTPRKTRPYRTRATSDPGTPDPLQLRAEIVIKLSIPRDLIGAQPADLALLLEWCLRELPAKNSSAASASDETAP